MQIILVFSKGRLIALTISIVIVNTYCRRLAHRVSLGGQIADKTFHVGHRK